MTEENKNIAKEFSEAAKMEVRKIITEAGKKKPDFKFISDRAEAIDIFVRNIEIAVEGSL